MRCQSEFERGSHLALQSLMYSCWDGGMGCGGGGFGRGWDGRWGWGKGAGWRTKGKEHVGC
eukprot:4335844-Pyramimonas_sp.AAC.1